MMQHVVFAYGFNLKFAKGLVADLTAEQMCQQPHGVVNHPAWSLGHLAASKVGLLKLLGHDASLPVGWGADWAGALPGAGGIPSSDPTGFPSKDELVSTFESLHDRVTTAVEGRRRRDPRDATSNMKARASIFRPSATMSCF